MKRKFSVNDKNRVQSLLFIIVCLLILVLPIVHIDQHQKSEAENRFLAVRPQLFSSTSSFNYNFGKAFDNWLADHFFLRDWYLTLHGRLQIVNGRLSSHKAFVGLNGWQFSRILKSDRTPYSKNKLQKIEQNIRYLASYCQDRNIACYLLVAPRREDYTGRQNFNLGIEDKAVAVVNRVRDIMPVLLPQEQFTKANNEQYVFFKTDHHWTEWGAYNGYSALMTRLAADFPEVRPVSLTDYNVSYSQRVRAEVTRKYTAGATCKLLNLPESACLEESVQYRYYDLAAPARVKKSNFPHNKQLFNCESAPNPQKTVVIGNSFVENFMVFWGPTFKESLKIRANDEFQDNLKLSRWTKEIAEFKPEIMVLVINSFYTFQLDTLSQ